MKNCSNLVLLGSILLLACRHLDAQTTTPAPSSREELLREISSKRMRPNELSEKIDAGKREDAADVMVAALSNPNVDAQSFAGRAILEMSEKSQRAFLIAALQKTELWKYGERYGWHRGLADVFEQNMTVLLQKFLGATFAKPDFEKRDDRLRIVALLQAGGS